jgi:hypothetical protein
LKPGKYRIFLEISAANTKKPKEKIIELKFSGEWSLKSTEEMAKVIVIK